MLGIVTLLYSLDYLPGTLTLGFQLRRLLPEGTLDKKLCLIASKRLLEEGQLTDSALVVLQSLYDEIIEIKPVDITNPIIQQNQANLKMLENRPELAFTFMKLHLWELTQYDKVLYLDSDVLPLDSDIFKIFEHVGNQTSDQIAAVPDCGWPDLFNSGVMVIKPSDSKFKELNELATNELSIDGADQGILNQFFNPLCHEGDKVTEWIRLPFFYNVTSPGAGYQYTPAIKFFANKLKLVHFIGKNKPWKHSSDNGFYNDKYRNQWWSLYMELCQKYFQSDLDIDIDAVCRNLNETKIEDNTLPRWNPAKEPPPKNLPPEAPHLDEVGTYGWESELVVLPDDHPSPAVESISEEKVVVEPPVKPKPIFPWESDTTFKATRVFPGDR